MPMHKDFEKILARFISQYGEEKGTQYFYAWVNKKGYDDTKSLASQKKGGEKKEFLCSVVGVEIKELEDAFHIEGLIATSHIDDLDKKEGIDVPDKIPKETLESFAEQINTTERARVMGVHHSEGRYINPEYFGIADVENNPARVVKLSDGEYGLYVDTKLLKDDPKTPEIIEAFRKGELNSFSITYDTDNFRTTDFDFVGDRLVRIIGPETKLYGYTAASNPVNPHAKATNYGYKEFKELLPCLEEKGDKKWIQKAVPEKNKGKFEEYCKSHGFEGVNQACINYAIKQGGHAAKMANFAINVSKGKYHHPEEKELNLKEVKSKMVKEQKEEPETTPVEEEQKPVEAPEEPAAVEAAESEGESTETEEKEMKEVIEKAANKLAAAVVSKIEMKEKVLKDASKETKEISLELKEFREILEKPNSIEIKEQFRRAAALSDSIGLDWRTATTSPAESREYKSFGTNGTRLEFKGLSITTNQTTDTDYLQSSAELQDVYDPVIYNALNQATVTWNLLAKDDYSKKGNNMVQFTLKTAANTSAAFYTGNSVSTGNVTRQKYQTKFKKLQVGVSVDGDMIAAARGGPVSDVFAQEVMDSTMDMLSVLNAALFAEKGAETDAEIIGFEYITDSAGNTNLYGYTRSAANKLAPDNATDTYINQGGTIISMTNLRAAIRQAVVEGANKRNLVFITNPTQANLLRGKFDDSRRMLSARDTDFGFSTDLWVDGVPVFEDKDCNTDDWWLVDLETHRVAIWVPPTLERLGKTADSEDAFIKTYLATYNRAPRRMVQIYGCATS